MTANHIRKHYLLASDFDQTLSYNDSGIVLCELLGIASFEEKVTGLARKNFVQQGAELSYLLRHDPEFRMVRKEHLVEVGKNVRLKPNVDALASVLNEYSDQYHFSFYVVSASPQEVVQSALEGIVPAANIFGTRFSYDDSGEIQSIDHCPAGYGKVTVINQLLSELKIAKSRLIYVGDGSSDIHVMLHINRLNGLTIAVSENKHIKMVAKRVVLADDVLGVAIPVFEEIMGIEADEIMEIFEANGYCIQEWDKVRSDAVIINQEPDQSLIHRKG